MFKACSNALIWCKKDSVPITHTDIIFHCQNGSVAAHKIILTVSCSFIKDIVSSLNNEDTITIFVPDYDVTVVKDFLELVYTGSTGEKSKQELCRLAHFGKRQLGFSLLNTLQVKEIPSVANQGGTTNNYLEDYLGKIITSLLLDEESDMIFVNPSPQPSELSIKKKTAQSSKSYEGMKRSNIHQCLSNQPTVTIQPLNEMPKSQLTSHDIPECSTQVSKPDQSSDVCLPKNLQEHFDPFEGVNVGNKTYFRAACKACQLVINYTSTIKSNLYWHLKMEHQQIFTTLTEQDCTEFLLKDKAQSSTGLKTMVKSITNNNPQRPTETIFQCLECDTTDGSPLNLIEVTSLT